MRILSLSLIICLLLWQSADARDIYVHNTGGDDLFDGTAADTSSQGAGPCRTIAKALRIARKGDRIILADTGVAYRESITVQGGRNSGFSIRPFVIRGNGAILDGSMPVPKESWEHYRSGMFRFRPPLQSYQQLFLDGLPATRVPVVSSGMLPKLKPLQWCLFDRHIYFYAEDGKLPQDYRLTFAGHAVGITLYQVQHVVIEDLIVQGFQLDGINAHDSAFYVNLVGVTSRGNGRSGVSVGGASRVVVEACLLGNNGAAQLRCEGWSHTKVVNSDLLDNTAPAIVRKGGKVKIENDP